MSIATRFEEGLVAGLVFAIAIAATLPALAQRADDETAKSPVPPRDAKVTAAGERAQKTMGPRGKARPGDKPGKATPAAPEREALAVPQSGKEIYERLLASTAWIVVRRADEPDVLHWGTGWIADEAERLLVTNHHVILASKERPRGVALDAELAVYFPRREKGRLVTDRSFYLRQADAVPATIFDSDVERDLAVLQLDTLPAGVRALPLAQVSAKPGEAIHSVGNPGASDALWIYTGGTVRQVYRARSFYDHGVWCEFNRVETQSPTNPGDSGGPVVNERGELVAVNQGFTEGRLISWFIDVSEVQDYLAEVRPFLHPDTADSYNDRGAHYYERQRYDRALADFSEAIRRDAKHSDAYNNRGWTLIKLDDAPTAIADFDQAIKIKASDPDYFEGRAQAHLIHGDADAAVADLTQALQLQPDSAEWYRQRGNAFHAAEKTKEALADLTRAIKLEPKSANLYNDRGIVYYDHDDYEEAIADFNRAIELDPEQAVFFYNRGNAYDGDDQLRRAASDYEQMEQLKPEFAREHRRQFNRRYFKLINTGQESVRVYVKYHTWTSNDEWKWFPAEESSWATYEFQPGEESYLSHDGFRINADRVRIWAETLDHTFSWQQYKTQPLVIVEEAGYDAYMMATFMLNVGKKKGEGDG